ncbi:hypothetical protein BN1723_009983 [Verticillium longisporum]|uniref:NADP-dependent oxidoreductase domain-containing protein n=1 Tax=Verticillium longisporum TaxID=100787 RepID=A0A0G4KUK2_VERLO|nr:hypothetical protein BN1723_009983 [Verticillium longisporum]
MYAIKVGYRLFDGAYDYQNEKEAGEGIQRAIKEGLVKREDIFITTKLWNNYHRKEHAIDMAKKQNEAWGLGYIDLFLIHFPCALKYIEPSKLPYPAWWTDAERSSAETDKVPIRETWESLESLVDEDRAPPDIHLAILPHRIPAQSLFHQTPPTQPDLQSYYLNQLAPLCYRDLDLNPSLRALGRQTLDRLTHRILLFCERHLRPVLAALADAGPVILEPIPLVTNDVAREEGLGHSFVPGRGMPRGRVTGALQPVIP